MKSDGSIDQPSDAARGRTFSFCWRPLIPRLDRATFPPTCRFFAQFATTGRSSDAEAQAAITALSGSQHDGRALTVNEAKPREARAGGSGGSREYGGSHR